MNIDYIQLIKDSAKFAWKYKILWVFGFILAVFSGGSSSSNNFSSSSDSSSGSSYDESMDKIGDSIDSFVNSEYFILVLVLGGIFLVLFLILRWYLVRVSKIALIQAVEYDHNQQENQIRLGGLWKGTHTYLKNVFLYDLFWFVVSLPFVIAVIGVVLLLIVGMSAVPSIGVLLCGVCCLGIPLGIVLMILVEGIKITAFRSIVIENNGVLESVKRGWEIFKTFWGKYVVAYLAALLPGCGFSLITVGIMMVTLLPLVFIVLGIVANSETVYLGIGIGVCGFCGVMLLVSLVGAPFRVFVETYWTKFIMILFGSKEERVDDGAIEGEPIKL